MPATNATRHWSTKICGTPEIAADDRIPDGIGEIGEDDRPVYDEEGYTHAPGE